MNNQIEIINYNTIMKIKKNVRIIKLITNIKINSSINKSSHAEIMIFNDGDIYLSQLFPHVQKKGVGSYMFFILLQKALPYVKNANANTIEINTSIQSHLYFNKMGFDYVSQSDNPLHIYRIKMKSTFSKIYDSLHTLIKNNSSLISDLSQ
jgi:hypothetical protein